MGAATRQRAILQTYAQLSGAPGGWSASKEQIERTLDSTGLKLRWPNGELRVEKDGFVATAGLSNVRPVSVNEEVELVQCAATFNMTVEEDGIQTDIKYSSQLADGGKTHLVTIDDAGPVRQTATPMFAERTGWEGAGSCVILQKQREPRSYSMRVWYCEAPDSSAVELSLKRDDKGLSNSGSGIWITKVGDTLLVRSDRALRDRFDTEHFEPGNRPVRLTPNPYALR